MSQSAMIFLGSPRLNVRTRSGTTVARPWKVARDHVHPFLSYRPTQRVSEIMQWLKGISSRVLLQEFPQLRKKFWGRHLWARGYLAVSSGTITDELIREYIDEQQGEQVADDSRFPIDNG
jgi:putative transposase